MGRGKSAKTLQLIEASRRILDEIQPATVRAVCYRLFTEGLIPNMGKSATGGVSKQLVYARENDLIPWDWIVDETREAERISSWDNPVQILRATVNQYRKDYWQFQRYRVEVWSEKGTVRGTVAPVLNKYGVTFRVMHGYGSATALYDVAQESVEVDKPLIVLYIGDWDCSGLHMSEIDLPARLARYGGEASIQRIALSAEDGPGLPSFPASDKANDSRYQDGIDCGPAAGAPCRPRGEAECSDCVGRNVEGSSRAGVQPPVFPPAGPVSGHGGIEMQAGTLDQRIELQELVEGFDDFGQPINEWQVFLSSWAAVEPLQGREYLAAMQNQSETTIRVRLRYRPGVKSAMRVKHGAKLYGIQSVIDVKSTGRELVLMCTATG